MATAVEKKEEELLGFNITSGKKKDKDFFGRDDELKNIYKYFTDRKHCMLKADRQYGKTSLGRKALEKYTGTQTNIFIDLNSENDISNHTSKLMKKYIESNIDTTTKKFQYSKLGSTLISSFLANRKLTIPGINVSLGKLDEDINSGKNVETFVNMISIIEQMSAAQNKQTLIFFDEFQKIIALTGDNYENFTLKFRAILQDLTYTTIMIAGSEWSILKKMVTPGGKDFFIEIEAIDVLPIKKEFFKKHLETACVQRKIRLQEDVVECCYYLTSGIASNLSYFGNKILNKSLDDAIAYVNCFDVFGIINDCIQWQIKTYEEKEKQLKSIEFGVKLFNSIGNNTYKEIENVESYDDSLTQLIELSIVREDKNGGYLVADKLFHLFMHYNTRPSRNRLIEKINKLKIQESLPHDEVFQLLIRK